MQLILITHVAVNSLDINTHKCSRHKVEKDFTRIAADFFIYCSQAAKLQKILIYYAIQDITVQEMF